MKRLSLWLGLMILSSCSFAQKSQIPPFYFDVSEKHNVPVAVAFALARTETHTEMSDGSMIPWPYTINLRGKSFYFNTQQEMTDFGQALVLEGEEKFDVGLYQVNWYWVGKHEVDSLDALGEPYSNSDVAMGVIKKYKTKDNTWAQAAGRYHNPNNNHGYADIYEDKFAKHLKKVNQILLSEEY